MTTVHAGYVVVLDNDLREDDAKDTITALKQIKGVLSVTPVEASPEVHIGEVRARTDLQKRLWDALLKPKV